MCDSMCAMTCGPEDVRPALCLSARPHHGEEAVQMPPDRGPARDDGHQKGTIVEGDAPDRKGFHFQRTPTHER